ncbi:MAG: aminopeptidase P family protein [Fibrobacteres bacterium]|nr:aminopeptidase P family protein [Fibrobacterota bacterium]
MSSFIPASECYSRISRLQTALAARNLDSFFIFDGVDQLYYTGTIQNGFLVVPASGEPVLFVRRNLERAQSESPLKNIYPYVSYRDALNVLKSLNMKLANSAVDESTMTVSGLKLLQKVFDAVKFTDAGIILRKVRAVKSAYEIDKMRQAGKNGSAVLSRALSLMIEGVTEWELALDIFRLTSMAGNSCIARMASGTGEFFLGNICFGDSSIYPTAFDGPGGITGRSPVCPYGGSLRKLKKGDLIFIDIGYPFEEYYVDKTRLFLLGAQPSPEMQKAHRLCLDVQEYVRRRLKPGEIPSKIYDDVYNEIIIPSGMADNFMGYGSNQVKFLGHGIGMVINEYPVIARKFDEPLEDGMTIALEPKKGIPGIGLLGTENTFIVTPAGGECITPDSDEIRIIG